MRIAAVALFVSVLATGCAQVKLAERPSTAREWMAPNCNKYGCKYVFALDNQEPAGAVTFFNERGWCESNASLDSRQKQDVRLAKHVAAFTSPDRHTTVEVEFIEAERQTLLRYQSWAQEMTCKQASAAAPSP